MSYRPALSPSDVVRKLENREQGMAARDLIDAMAKSGYDVDDVVRLVRTMLSSGELGLGRGMDIRLLKQPA